jgi:hypothetical protein
MLQVLLFVYAGRGATGFPLLQRHERRADRTGRWRSGTVSDAEALFVSGTHEEERNREDLLQVQGVFF